MGATVRRADAYATLFGLACLLWAWSDEIVSLVLP